MHAATRFDGGVIWRVALGGLLGELGDKTFYLIIALAAWCPLRGLRCGGQAPAERCLVFAGALAALNLRAVLLAMAQDSTRWVCWPDAVACVLLALLGARAAFERSSAGAPDIGASLNTKEPSAAGPDAAHHGKLAWNKDACSGFPREPCLVASEQSPSPGPALPAPASETLWNASAFSSMPHLPADAEAAAQGYGSVSAFPQVRPAARSASIDEPVASLVLAFPLAFCMAFVTEADDKSEAALLPESSHGADMAVGASLGFLPAGLTAALMGHVLERQLEQRQALLLVVSILLSLCLVSLTQGLLHVSTQQRLPAASSGEGA